MSGLTSKYWLPVEWDVPVKIKAYYTTRYPTGFRLADLKHKSSIGDSDYSDFNLALHVGDDPNSVNQNRAYLKDSLALPGDPVWLEQTHSNRVLDLDLNTIPMQSAMPADGSITRSANKVCCVMTADCLPVLLSNRQGDWVSAIHAGWRGLASGIIENAVNQYSGATDEIVAWLGPAISQPKFEIGAEVKDIFVTQNGAYASAFKTHSNGKYLADLYLIATTILKKFGIDTFGGQHCTFQEPDKFYSYRRHATTGRMASLIWINNQ